jgi:hypothetical protein
MIITSPREIENFLDRGVALKTASDELEALLSQTPDSDATAALVYPTCNVLLSEADPSLFWSPH